MPVVVVEAARWKKIFCLQRRRKYVALRSFDALEEAGRPYRALIRDFQRLLEMCVARMVSRRRSRIAKHAAATDVTRSGQGTHIHSGRLSAGHARALVGHPDAERLAEEIVAQGFNVRQVENITRQGSGRAGKRAPKIQKNCAAVAEIR